MSSTAKDWSGVGGLTAPPTVGSVFRSNRGERNSRRLESVLGPILLTAIEHKHISSRTNNL